MDLAKENIFKALKSCLRALVNLHKGDKRLVIGDLDHAKHYAQSAIYILLNEIEDENQHLGGEDTEVFRGR